jgi:hypothetical protein
MVNTNNKINQGHFISFFSDLKINMEKKERGIIQSALANLTVVAIFSASSPYVLAAPTTELVS